MPAWRKTLCRGCCQQVPDDRETLPPACLKEIIDFDTKPEARGKEEIDNAPTMPQIVVSGMVRNRPPRSVHLRACRS